HPRAVRVGVAAEAVVEELHPCGSGARAQRVHVVLDLEQIAARGTAINHLAKTELSRASIDALKPGVVAHTAPTISRPDRPRATPTAGDPSRHDPAGLTGRGLLSVLVLAPHLDDDARAATLRTHLLHHSMNREAVPCVHGPDERDRHRAAFDEA